MPMLLPDNIHPEQSIYYNGAFVLQALREHRVLDLLDLYVSTQTYRTMTMPVFVLLPRLAVPAQSGQPERSGGR